MIVCIMQICQQYYVQCDTIHAVILLNFRSYILAQKRYWELLPQRSVICCWNSPQAKRCVSHLHISIY